MTIGSSLLLSYPYLKLFVNMLKIPKILKGPPRLEGAIFIYAVIQLEYSNHLHSSLYTSGKKSQPQNETI